MTTLYQALAEIDVTARKITTVIESLGMKHTAVDALSIVDRVSEIRRLIGVPVSADDVLCERVAAEMGAEVQR